MNVEVVIQDLKGITEYSKEEKESEELKKQIRVAEGILEMVIKKLCKNYPLLHPAIRMFELVPVKEEIWLETDGIHLFYQPEKIQDLYANRMLKNTEKKYLHLVIHGLLGHFSSYSKLGQDPLWDAVMDYEVNMITGSMLCSDVEGVGRKRLGTRGLYWYAKKRMNVEAQLRNFRDWDNHAVWERGKEIIIHTSQGGNDSKGDDSPPMGIGIPKEEIEENIRQKWKNIHEMIGLGKEVKEQNLKKMIRGKMQGYVGGDEEEIYEAGAENRNSYREYILQYIRERETLKEQEGTIDKMLYSFGFEFYGDVALIEPEEFSENKVLDKVVIAVDTSGSCHGETMNEFLRETKNLLQDISEISSFREVILMQCDAEIQKEEHFGSAAEFPEKNFWKMKGFGGTDFRPVFEKVEEIVKEEQGEIDFLVYFSDGYGAFPKEKPKYPVIFVLPEKNERIPEWVIPVFLEE